MPSLALPTSWCKPATAPHLQPHAKTKLSCVVERMRLMFNAIPPKSLAGESYRKSKILPECLSVWRLLCSTREQHPLQNTCGLIHQNDSKNHKMQHVCTFSLPIGAAFSTTAVSSNHESITGASRLARQENGNILLLAASQANQRNMNGMRNDLIFEILEHHKSRGSTGFQ